LKANGASYSKIGDWQPYAVDMFIDYRSKPASSKLVAEKLLNQLNSKK
jgi:hypothetical protein